MPKDRKFSHYSYRVIDPNDAGQQKVNTTIEILLKQGFKILFKNDDGTQVAITTNAALNTLSSNKAVSDQLLQYLFVDKDSEFDDFINSFTHLSTKEAPSSTTFLIEKGKKNDIILTRTTTRSIISGSPGPEINLIDQEKGFYSKSSRIHISPVNVPKDAPPQATVQIQSIETVNMECLDKEKAECIKELGGKEQFVKKINVLKNMPMRRDHFDGEEQKVVYIDKRDAAGIRECVSPSPTVDFDKQTLKVLRVYACNAVESYANKNQFFPDAKYAQDIKQLFNLFGFNNNKFATAVPFLMTRNAKELYDLFKDFKISELVVIKNTINNIGKDEQSYINLAKNISDIINAKEQIKEIKSYLSSNYLFGGNISRFFSKTKTEALKTRVEKALYKLGEMINETNTSYLNSILKDNFNTYELIQIDKKIPFDFSGNQNYEKIKKMIADILKPRGIDKDYYVDIQIDSTNSNTCSH